MGILKSAVVIVTRGGHKYVKVTRYKAAQHTMPLHKDEQGLHPQHNAN
jgi:hypothetical protein